MGLFPKPPLMSLVVTILVYAVLVVNGFVDDDGYYVEEGKECPHDVKICVYSLFIEEQLVVKHNDTYITEDSSDTKETFCNDKVGKFNSKSNTCYMNKKEVGKDKVQIFYFKFKFMASPKSLKGL